MADFVDLNGGKMVLGITGGVGCGKSTLMNLLKDQYQAKILVADELGHQALEPGTPVYDRVRKTFGLDLVLPDGRIDRSLLADRIYADEEKREKLNGIIHPYVRDRIRQSLENWRGEPLVCLETALLFETGCDRFCDAVWCVLTDRELRIQRLMHSRGYTREKAEAIMKAQLSDEEWKKRSDACIVNDGDLHQLEERLQELLVMG